MGNLSLGYSGWSHYLIKQFMAKTKKQTAEHYFRQGIKAAYTVLPRQRKYDR